MQQVMWNTVAARRKAGAHLQSRVQVASHRRAHVARICRCDAAHRHVHSACLHAINPEADSKQSWCLEVKMAAAECISMTITIESM